MPKLRTETNEPEIAGDILESFPHHEEHDDIKTFFEHGQWWVQCDPCGAQWSVHDLNDDDYGFEIVTTGDGTCIPEDE